MMSRALLRARNRTTIQMKTPVAVVSRVVSMI